MVRSRSNIKLAWRALHPVLPSKEEFPYTIRVLSDITESNGSSSMSTLAPVVATISRMTLPPVPDDVADLYKVDLHRLDLAACADSSSRVWSSALAISFRMRAAFLALGRATSHDLSGDAGDLDVHLHRGDAFSPPANLEIHVAEMILVAEDVA